VTNRGSLMLRKLSGVFVGLYGLMLLILFAFAFLWDNKGASGTWEKSTADWLLIIWLAISALVVLYGASHCMFSQRRTYVPLLLVGAVLLVNIVLLVIRSSGEAVMYLGVPHLIACVGVVLWLGTEINERKQMLKHP